MNQIEIGEEIKNIIFVSEGGIGKVIASTCVVGQLKKLYPDKNIIVISGSTDVWMHNPNVSEIYDFRNPLHFYERYFNPESYILHVEPYRHQGYLHGDTHLIDAWCDLAGIPRPEVKKPELYFLKKEKEAAEIFYNQATDNKKKKLALLQWIGGIIPKDKRPESTLEELSKMQKRAIPRVLAQQIVNSLIGKNYAVCAIQHENFQDLQGVHPCKSHMRNILSLLFYADAFIGIDSFMQHAAAALDVRGVVVWGGTNPERLGYPIHLNLNKVRETEGHMGCKKPNCHRPNSYIFDVSPNGHVWNCPHDEVCLDYKLEEIIKGFEKVYPSKSTIKKQKRAQRHNKALAEA